MALPLLSMAMLPLARVTHLQLAWNFQAKLLLEQQLVEQLALQVRQAQLVEPGRQALRAQTVFAVRLHRRHR